jgi:DNA-binding SARP family transcriptional activator/predicted ATPase
MPTLHIKLLGDFQLAVDETPIKTVNQPRLQSLLAYLLLRRHAPQPRHHLAFCFWPQLTEAQARNNLRQMLHQLRQALPDSGQLLATDVNTVQWLADGPFRLDVAEFDAAVAQAVTTESGPDRRAACQALRQAANLYTGDLLPSCYEDWIIPERDRLRQQCQSLLTRLVAVEEELREYPSALEHAQRLLRLDPYNEETVLGLMRLHALNRDRAGALRAYHDCVSLLRRELAVEPGAAVQAAYEQLLRSAAPPAPPAAQPAVFSSTTPLIGRDLEWGRLRQAWKLAAAGRASFALITGEAGIGKTRLAEELLGWAAPQGIGVARTRAYEAEGSLSYSSLGDWLRGSHIAAGLGRLETVWLNEIARLLPELLAKYPGLSAPGPLTEFWQRQRFFEALARAVLAGGGPLLLQIDDLQWCDQETLEWLHFLERFDPAAPLLIVGTARAEEMTRNAALRSLLRSLRTTDHLTELPLAPLDAAETARLAAGLAGRELDDAQAARLFQETEGNPLFASEMVRGQFAGFGGPAGAGAEQPISAPQNASLPYVLPPKVYAVIADRLAQLSPLAYELVGAAATIGRAFTLDVLALVCNQPGDELVNALDEIWQRRIIREQAGNAYDFSHDKLREVAYLELSPMHRRSLHRRAAQALASVYAANLDPVSAQMAAHYEQAGLPAQAIASYRRAGEVAQRLFANDEAISLYNRALLLLPQLTPGPTRDELELALLTALGVSLVVFQGYAAPEVIEVYTRARALGEQLGQPPIAPVLRALAIAQIVRAEFQPAYDLGAQLLELAEQRKDPVLKVEAHYVLGVASFWMGNFAESRGELEQVVGLYDPRQSQTHIALFSQNPKIICLSRLALTLWCLGFWDEALQMADEAIALGRQLGHPLSLAYALTYASFIQSLRRAAQVTRVQSAEVTTLAREHRLGQFLQMGKSFHGWALAEQGLFEAGVVELSTAMADYRAVGCEHIRPYYLTLLAEQHGKAGDAEYGLVLLAEALDLTELTGERWSEAEARRVNGEMLLRTGQIAEGEAALWQALEVARAQQARAFELRAAMSLARLWQSQGQLAQARPLLAPIVNWFGGRVDTPDLREARFLLDSLQEQTGKEFHNLSGTEIAAGLTPN